jgi:hypothetical protein
MNYPFALVNFVCERRTMAPLTTGGRGLLQNVVAVEWGTKWLMASFKLRMTVPGTGSGVKRGLG